MNMNKTPLSFQLRAILAFAVLAVLTCLIIAFKSGKEVGWIWFLEFAAALLANIIAAICFVLWFEPEGKIKLNELAERLRPSGSRVIPSRSRQGAEIYEEHIKTSDEVVILGIACKPALRGVFPTYDKDNEPFEIGNCQRSVLYKRLKAQGRPFSANIFFLNPTSSYAHARNSEAENNDTLKDLTEIVSALQKIANAYTEHKPSSKQNEDRWKLAWALQFWVFDNHPINTVFWASKPTAKDALFVGYLFSRANGRDCPAVEFIDENEVHGQCQKHLAAIRFQSRLLFKWNHDGPHFYPEALTSDAST